MDSILSQEREHRNFAVSGHDQYRTGVTSDSFPRSLAQPLAMDSSLPTGFTLWPPTPLPHGGRATDLHPSDYPTTLPEEFPTSSPWEPLSSAADTHAMTTGPGMDIPSHYSGSPLEPFGVRENYSTVFPHYGTPEGGLASSYGSNSSHSGHQFPYQPPQDSDTLSLNTNLSRRLSGTSLYTDGSSGYEDSVPTSFEDYTRSVTSTSGSTPLSPVMSPGQGRMSARSSSRGLTTRASPSPSHQHRAVPYPKSDFKRWSTGTFSPNVDPQLQRVTHTHHASAHPHSHSHESSPTIAPLPAPFLPSHPFAQRPLLANAFPYEVQQAMVPTHYPCLSSNDGCEFSERPDLYGSLTEEHIPPPPEDMNPSDPDLKPHEQDLRFDGDLYTPRWVRGHGNKREGWCGICKPGRWLVLKNSAFWYDKSFTHGISAATGLAFHEPRDMRRMDGNPDVWEGLCHSCNEWVPLVSNKKKGTTWFRHAYKCHTHPKIKDAPKRRRESSQGKAAQQAAQKAKAEALRADYVKRDGMMLQNGQS